MSIYTGNNFGVISQVNSYSNTSFTGTFNGPYENVQNYSLITLSIYGKTSNSSISSGTLTASFSADGTNICRTINYPVQDLTSNGITANSINSTAFNPVHTIVPIAKYFKLSFVSTTSTGVINLINISTIYHNNANKAVTSRVTQYVTDYTDTDTSKAIITGRTEGTLLPGGNYQNITAQNGSLNVRIREPITAFGEVLTASLTPFVQFDFTSGMPLPDLITTFQNNPYTGTTGASSYNYIESKGNITVNGPQSLIELRSNLYTKYKPGQGCDNRFTAKFSGSTGPTGYIPECDQYAGIFTAEDSLTFGYFGHTVIQVIQELMQIHFLFAINLSDINKLIYFLYQVQLLEQVQYQ